jgi:hypothetical protein
VPLYDTATCTWNWDLLVFFFFVIVYCPLGHSPMVDSTCGDSTPMVYISKDIFEQFKHLMIDRAVLLGGKFGYDFPFPFFIRPLRTQLN